MCVKDSDILWAFKRVSDSDILGAVERLRDEWPALFGDEAGTLAEHLSATPRDDPQAVRQVADRILELLQANPLAQARVGDELKLKGYRSRVLRSDDSDLAYARVDSLILSDMSEEIPAGTVMVCPVDATHYRRILRQKGQFLYCPEHNVALVPEG